MKNFEPYYYVMLFIYCVVVVRLQRNIGRRPIHLFIFKVSGMGNIMLNENDY